MKTFNQLLEELNACKEAREWAGEMTIEEVVEKCERGGWLLWLAARVEVNKRKITLAKGYCANTVRHLMKDERSIKAIDATIAYGEGKATDEELTNAANAAYTAYAAADAAVYAAAYAAYTAYAAAYASAAAAAASAVASAASAVAYVTSDSDAAKKANQMQTANICREVIGQEIIEKVNKMLN